MSAAPLGHLSLTAFVPTSVFNTEQPRDDDHRPAVSTGNSHRHWSNCAWADTKDHARRYGRRRHGRCLAYRGQPVGEDAPLGLCCENQLGFIVGHLCPTVTKEPSCESRRVFCFANARHRSPIRLSPMPKPNIFSCARYARVAWSSAPQDCRSPPLTTGDHLAVPQHVVPKSEKGFY